MASTVGSSKPVVKIETEVKIASGVFLNQLNIFFRSISGVLLSRCFIGNPAALNVS
ncbi:hypothetical protein D3C86_2223210 [compost metagenome]